MSDERRIMNIPCALPDLAGVDAAMAYKLGHRDARHAAVEIACGADAAIAEMGAVRVQASAELHDNLSFLTNTVQEIGEWNNAPAGSYQNLKFHEAAEELADALYDAWIDGKLIAAIEPASVSVREAARADALASLEQLEAVEDAYTRWMLANAVGDPDMLHREGNKLSKALFAMLNNGPDDGPSAILRALRAIAEGKDDD